MTPVKLSDRKILQNVLLSIPLAILAACNEADDLVPPQGNDLEQQEVEAPMTLNRQVALSKADLAERLSVPLESVALSGARQVTWRTGALGCPEPGMNYTEALVPGAVIYLQVDNTIHAYHASFAGEPFYCPRERAKSPVADEGEDLT
jgi:hypothetical protein